MILPRMIIIFAQPILLISFPPLKHFLNFNFRVTIVEPFDVNVEDWTIGRKLMSMADAVTCGV